MSRQLITFLGTGTAVTLLLAWIAYPGHIFRSRTRFQQRISLLLAPGLATGLALATYLRGLFPSLSNPASNPLTWLPITLSALAALLVQSSSFAFVLWIVWRLLSQFGPSPS